MASRCVVPPAATATVDLIVIVVVVIVLVLLRVGAVVVALNVVRVLHKLVSKDNVPELRALRECLEHEGRNEGFSEGREKQPQREREEMQKKNKKNYFQELTHPLPVEYW